ncbi:MAG: DUF5591 domain-containing protein [Candidatus Thermoplasmatota archaeon]|nr:DUF5591 domain-containing protein [Candidatus Thermoplasmatota archaeon]
MNERPIGRDVKFRDRFSRLISLGDRNNPASWSPGLIISDEDPTFPVSIAPLLCIKDPSEIPPSMEIKTRDNLCFPFESKETWSVTNGLVLPPSLAESDSGDFGHGIEAIPVSWNSLHHDKSLLQLEYPPSLLILTDSPQLAKNSGMLEKALLTLRTTFPGSLIWTPGIAGPDNCALLSWLGVDIFVFSRSWMASSLGVLLTESGPRKVEPTTNEDSSLESQARCWVAAISATRSAIRDGTLRELAERQSTSSPNSVAHLRRHDALTFEISSKIGVSQSVAENGKKMRCHSFESRNDSTIREWREKISETYSPPKHQKELLVLLPCSARKPYKLSQSHARFRRVIRDKRAHEIMVTAPLGLVPRELEDLWPAAHYDIPVTGDWDHDELEIIREMVLKLVNRIGYKSIVNHSGVEISVKGTEVTDTRMGDPAGSADSLTRLKNAIDSAISKTKELPSDYHFRYEVMKSISRFHLGSDEWLEGCSVRGRPPILTITKDGTQFAKWNPRSGRFSLSKSSLGLMMELDALKVVQLRSDVDWVGDIFPSFVQYFDPRIKIGDELLIIQDERLLGSARAIASGWEWPHGPGKLAKSRHRL